MAVGSAKRVEISILPVIAVAQYPCTKNAQEPDFWEYHTVNTDLIISPK
jgi:hypothetical protein